MEPMLERLEGLLIAKWALEENLDRIEQEEKEVRELLFADMNEKGIKSIAGPNNKVVISAVTRRDLKVADEPSVRTYLKTNGLLEECLRLDLATVKRFAKVQDIPGIQETETTSLQVRRVQEKVEAVQPEESVRGFHSRMNNK